MRELAVHASPVVPEMRELAVIQQRASRPRSFAAAIPRTNPSGHTMQPPSGSARIEPLRIGGKIRRQQCSPLVHQPQMPRRQIQLRNQINRSSSRANRVALDCPPRIDHVPVDIVHDLKPREWLRPA